MYMYCTFSMHVWPHVQGDQGIPGGPGTTGAKGVPGAKGERGVPGPNGNQVRRWNYVRSEYSNLSFFIILIYSTEL